MDKSIIISAAVMAVIATIEILCLFCCSKLRMKKIPITAIYPIFPSDNFLNDKLDYISEMFLKSSCPIDRAIFIDYGATEQQINLCNEFCRLCPEISIISPDKIETFLSETFAIAPKI